MKTLPIHPLANRFPEMSPAEYAALKVSIANHGQIDPVVLLDGKILDGRHRDRACGELGKETKTIDFKAGWGDPVDFVIARSNHRNMSDGQKCWSAAQFVDDIARSAGRKKNGLKSEPINGKSLDIAAMRFGVSVGNVVYARTLMAKAPSLFAKLGADRAYNVNRAMQEYRRDSRQRDIRRKLKAAAGDLCDCRLLLGDAVEQLSNLPARYARVVFADPPYNIGKRYHGDKHGDAREDDDFLAWCEAWLRECARVLTADGSIFVMINGLYAAPVEMILRKLELHRRNTIYWWENNPENQKGNFSDAVRPVHYFTRSATDFLFFDDVKVDSRRNQIGDKRGLDGGKLPDNVWIDCRIPGNSLERVPYADAPPQLPVAIPERCILVASEPGDTVLDPFNGNGTTAIAALANGRKYVGIDRSKKYLAQAEQWIKSQLQQRRSA